MMERIFRNSGGSGKERRTGARGAGVDSRPP